MQPASCDRYRCAGTTALHAMSRCHALCEHRHSLLRAKSKHARPELPPLCWKAVGVCGYADGCDYAQTTLGAQALPTRRLGRAHLPSHIEQPTTTSQAVVEDRRPPRRHGGEVIRKASATIWMIGRENCPTNGARCATRPRFSLRASAAQL